MKQITGRVREVQASGERSPRRLWAAAAGTAAALFTSLLLTVLTPSASFASATGCTGGTSLQACVEVQGSGLHVDRVRSIMKIGVNYGGDFDMELWGGTAFYYTCCGASYWGQQTVYGPWHNVNINLPNGTGVCSTVRQYPNTRLLTACVTIHS